MSCSLSSVKRGGGGGHSLNSLKGGLYRGLYSPPYLGLRV